MRELRPSKGALFPAALLGHIASCRAIQNPSDARRSQPASLQESAHSMLLSVAVFAGRSGRMNRFGLFLVTLGQFANGLLQPLALDDVARNRDDVPGKIGAVFLPPVSRVETRLSHVERGVLFTRACCSLWAQSSTCSHCTIRTSRFLSSFPRLPDIEIVDI